MLLVKRSGRDTVEVAHVIPIDRADYEQVKVRYCLDFRSFQDGCFAWRVRTVEKTHSKTFHSKLILEGGLVSEVAISSKYCLIGNDFFKRVRCLYFDSIL